MTTLALDHINLRADRATLDALKDFYCDVVGLHVGARPPFPNFGYWLYAGDRPVVHLYQAGDDETRRNDVATTFDHVAFRCEGSDGVEALLRERGIAFRKAVVPGTGQVQFFLADPAGNKVELNFSEARGAAS